VRIPIGSPFRHDHLVECESTQDLAIACVRQAELVGIISTDHQTKGRGRFSRRWESQPGDSLMFSAIQWGYADYPSMPLLGMAWAIAVAELCDAQLQWPNDVVINGKKVAGVLTEVALDPGGRRIPVVGIGLNLRQAEFPPEIAHRATSLAQQGRDPKTAAQQLSALLEISKWIPDPDGWAHIADRWMSRDVTPGKRMKLPNGMEVEAREITSSGRLLAESQSGTLEVDVAEVLY